MQNFIIKGRVCLLIIYGLINPGNGNIHISGLSNKTTACYIKMAEKILLLILMKKNEIIGGEELKSLLISLIRKLKI